MFGYVTANMVELTEDQRTRYGQVYCGICRGIREHSGQLARLTLRYDMAFLALLLMSLYEPEETSGKNRCLTHPIRPKPWTDNPIIRYCADMNVALAYWKCLDDRKDDGNAAAGWMARQLEDSCYKIALHYPRQWKAMEDCLGRLSALERENCADADMVSGCFGELMAELLVLREDHWSPRLRQMGNSLGRFVYLLDAAADYRRDLKKGSYNPWIARDEGEQYALWEEHLVNILGRCVSVFEELPLVQDKALLDNILYSGVWVNYRNRRKEGPRDGSL